MVRGGPARWRPGRRLTAATAVAALAAAAAGASAGAPTRPAPLPASAARAHAPACLTPAVRRALRRSVAYARHRYHEEANGLAAHVALRRAARDARLLHALRVHDLAVARAEGERLLVGHLVRLRVVSGARVLVDANASSFAVKGPSQALRARGGRVLGQLSVTVQDVIGFVKLVERHGNADTVVRGTRGQTATLLASVPRPLPRSGCATTGGVTYAVGSFPEVSFTGEALTVWILVATPPTG